MTTSTKIGFLGCCLFFGVFRRGLEIGRDMDVFGDL